MDPDETPHSATSHLGLHCLLRPVILNTYGKYGTTDVGLHCLLSHVSLIFGIKYGIFVLFVCVEVLQPSQTSRVMSRVVSIPNHTFTGQALSSKRLTSIVHSLLRETDNCSS